MQTGRVYFPTDHTADEWRAMANECDRLQRESFARSDTDGALSQWAHSLNAQLYRTLAEVAERNGMWTFEMLADAEGNIIEGARHLRTAYGWAWRTPDGGWFNPSQAQNPEVARARNLAKGFQLVTVERPAVVVLQSGDGMFNCYPVILPKHDRQS